MWTGKKREWRKERCMERIFSHFRLNFFSITRCVHMFQSECLNEASKYSFYILQKFINYTQHNLTRRWKCNMQWGCTAPCNPRGNTRHRNRSFYICKTTSVDVSESKHICPYNEWSLIRKIKNLYVLERTEMVCLGHGQNLYFSILIIPKFKAKEWHWINFFKICLCTEEQSLAI